LLKLKVPAVYLPQVPVLVRVEVIDPLTGRPDRNLWDADAILSTAPSLTLSTNRIVLRNGLGSGLVTFTGGGDFTLTATVGSLSTNRSIQSRAGAPVTTASGSLAASTTWTGVVQLVGTVTVPTGRTLTIESNSLVIINGVASGTAGFGLVVNGTLNSLGTELHPVTITCADAALRWGQIRHDNAQPSLYRHTIITRGGRAPGEGHTAQAPVLRPNNSAVTFESCSITDHADANGTPGKIGYGINSDLTFRNCLLSRARMGPEIQGTALSFTNSWIVDMHGPDDSDGIYLHDQQAGQQLRLVDSVMAFGDDDGIDTLSADVTVENCVIRDWPNPNEDAKGISAFNRTVTVKRCLIVDCWVGISAKANAATPATVTIENSTIIGISNTVAASIKANAPGPIIDFRITNSILRGIDAVKTDFGPTNFTIGYCNISESWPGTGNLTADPLFVNQAAHDFHLRAASPAINAGNPNSPLDADGTRADMGFFPFLSVTNQLIAFGSSWRYLDNGTDQGTNWAGRTFDDSTWASGPAQLGYGDGDEATIVSFGPDMANKYITTYFRRSFSIGDAASYTNLALRLLRDDGAVVYLNGAEIFRSPTLPPGPIAFNTLAIGLGENDIDVATVNGGLPRLLDGTNVIAVEIHQQALSSSDISFDLELVGTTGINGGGGANTPPLVSVTAPANNATYTAPANVTITADASDPGGAVTKVEFFQNGNKLGEDSTSPYSYDWVNAGAGVYSLTAVATDNQGATTTSSPINVTINSGNAPVTNSLIALGSSWKYLDNGTDQGTAWSAPGFNDSTWASGPAQLGYGDADEATVISFGPDPNNKYVTSYFRRSFTVTDPARIQSLLLNVLRDDGAITYINGVEVFRQTMPPGPVTYLTYATTASEYGFEATNFPASVLVAGNNVIACEVHQGNANSSDVSFELELLAVMSAETNSRPVVSLTAPTDGLTMAAPANLTLTAAASDPDGTVTNVAFFANGGKLADDTAAPFSFSWNSVPAGTYLLTAVATDNVGLVSTSAVVTVTVSTNTAPPIVLSKTPAPGNVTSLTQISVTFSKPVLGVNATDLLINGVPASTVTGSGTDFTFSFAQPNYGTVSITWAVSHGITDVFTPPAVFDRNGTGATWQYQLLDANPPVMMTLNPTPGSSIAALTSVSITFNEPVTGVNASDLRVNSVPTSTVSGSGAGPYVFGFPQPGAGTVQLNWITGHGIQDTSGNPFAGGTWSYTLDTNAVGVIISEIMYHPSSENVLEEYIELFNKGGTAVNLNGWRFSGGVQFTFPNITLPGGGYLVVAANTNVFATKYPDVNNVVGNWTGFLNNAGEDIDLDDAQGDRVDSVRFADEGDWAIRQRGPLMRNHRGWVWVKEHDGFGKSLELINPNLSNNDGQNWAASRATNGSPGVANSVLTNNIPPMILGTVHFPLVPKSTDQVVVTARILDESPNGLTVTLNYRVNAVTPPAFIPLAMRDDGTAGDAASGDGIYSAVVPPQNNNAVVEYFIRASDQSGATRTWPAPVVAAPDGAGPTGQVANALFQIDDSTYTGSQPLYKLIMTESERAELAGIPCSGDQDSDAQMNGTFISMDTSGADLRYLVGYRNRGHGSRCASPPNYRVSFRSDERWKDVTALNLNSVNTFIQHFGGVVSRKAGVVGSSTLAVQVRVNNANLAISGSPMFGAYAAVEVLNGDWASHHFPTDGNGNVYRVIRDIPPPDFSYRGETPGSYQNTWFKESNESENDWTDLIGMLRVVGINNVTSFTTDNVRQVINVEQWLRHLAVMNILGNNETGLNTGYNDDYYMYRGVTDPRFILSYHDLDTVLGVGGSLAPNAGLFTATANNGSGLAMDRLMNWPDFRPRYFQILQELMNTTFAQANFNQLVDQTLGDYVTSGATGALKTWMDQRRASILSQIPAFSITNPPVATLTGTPRSPTPRTSAILTVGGPGIVAYRFALNGGAYGSETPVATVINLTSLSNGTNTVSVIGKDTNSLWQATSSATVRSWVVDTSIPAVRLNEVLARNDSAVNHSGTFPDVIELFNEGVTTVDLSGLRLTDDASSPNKFTFPAGTTLAAGAYLTVYANNPDGTAGLHLGFSLDQNGEGVFLIDRLANGNNVLDSVVFGLQLPNLSIGRLGTSGEWLLTVPTFGAANAVQSLGDPRALRINEWLASGVSPFADDFIELYNPNVLPVALGGLHLTDQPNGAPMRSPLAPLSFIAANGYAVFIADGDGDHANHVNFKIAIEQGELGLTAADATVIDCVIFGPQHTDISSGRCPDGSLPIKFLALPTPGGPNACPVAPPAPITINLIPIAATWRYNESGLELGTAWRNPAFDDSAWPSGPALLARETAALPEPILTPLNFTNPQQTNFYFRTRFTMPANLNPTRIEIQHVIDDGAIVYVNGVEVHRTNMPAGPVNATTLAVISVSDATYQGPFEIPIGSVAVGENVVAVEVHQQNPTSTDLVFGLRMDAVIVTNSPAAAGIVINEVLADNATLEEPDGSKPDWVELYNPSTNGVNIADMSLSDDVATPRRWVVPAGTTLAAKGFVKLRFDPDLPASNTNAGFGLKANGGSVYLFNRLADGGGLASAVSYGLQAADWSLGRVPDGSSNWVLNVPSLSGANIAAALGDPLQLKINEWMADPASGDDWFEVFNPNAQPVDISHLWLSDDLVARMKHQIPALSFIGAGPNAYQKFDAIGTATPDANKVNFSLRAAGEAVAISTASGVLINGVSFGPQATGVSEGRLPDGSDTRVFFPLTATPGNANFLPIGNVVINELLSHTDPPLEDAVEIFNPTGDDVNIGGWYLSDSQNNLLKYLIPANTIVRAGGFVVFYENQFNLENPLVPFSFSSAKGDEVYLSQASSPGVLTGYRAFAEFGPSENGVSFGRYRTSVGVDFTALSTRTFGVDNPGTVEQFRTGTGKTNTLPRVGPVVINEIMYHPPGTNDALEFVELHNILGTPQPLFDPANPMNTWRMRKGVDFNFPTNTTIPAGGFIVLVNFDPATDPVSLSAFRAAYGSSMTVLGPYSGKLDNSGEALELQKPDAPQTLPGPDFGLVPYIAVDRVVYSDAAPWPTTPDGFGNSLKRITPSSYGNDPVNWAGGIPNPGAANTSGGPVNTAPVLGSIGNKTVIEGNLVSFTATANDGDVPAQTLTFSLDVGAPANATITPGGAFAWNPGEADGPGAYQVTIRVTDSGSPVMTDFETITISVTETNSQPVLNPIGNKSGAEGTAITFNATATDSDLPAQSLTFSLDAGAPAGAGITAGGAFSWTPTESQGPGSYPITVRVTDNGTPARSASETIQVTVNEVNVAPVLNPIGNKTVSQGRLLSFTATATDADFPAQALTFSLGAGAPSGAAITAGGAFTWTPTAAQAPSTNSITIRVTDAGSLTATQTISVIVVGAPTITSITRNGSSVVIQWQTYPGKTYQVQAKPDLSTPTWTNVGSPVTAAGTSSSATIPMAGNNLRFFQVILTD
jgi:hypothetical protein